MSTFATGKHAFGFCERCAFRYDLRELKAETVKGHNKGNMICPECWDQDHPQLWVGSMKVDDPQALKRPAIDIGLDSANAFPTLNVSVSNVGMVVFVGNVGVTTS